MLFVLVTKNKEFRLLLQLADEHAPLSRGSLLRGFGSEMLYCREFFLRWWGHMEEGPQMHTRYESVLHWPRGLASQSLGPRKICALCTRWKCLPYWTTPLALRRVTADWPVEAGEDNSLCRTGRPMGGGQVQPSTPPPPKHFGPLRGEGGT